MDFIKRQLVGSSEPSTRDTVSDRGPAGSAASPTAIVRNRLMQSSSTHQHPEGSNLSSREVGTESIHTPTSADIEENTCILTTSSYGTVPSQSELQVSQKSLQDPIAKDLVDSIIIIGYKGIAGGDDDSSPADDTITLKRSDAVELLLRCQDAEKEMSRFQHIANSLYTTLKAQSADIRSVCVDHERLEKAVVKFDDELASVKKSYQLKMNELENLVDLDDDQQERERYVKDLEKELKQWRKLGADGDRSGNIMNIPPLEKVQISDHVTAASPTARASDSTKDSHAGEYTPCDARHTELGNSSSKLDESIRHSQSPAPFSIGLNAVSSGVASGVLSSQAEHVTESDLTSKQAEWAAMRATLTREIEELQAREKTQTVRLHETEAMLRNCELRYDALVLETSAQEETVNALYKEATAYREQLKLMDQSAAEADNVSAALRKKITLLEDEVAEVNLEKEDVLNTYEALQTQLLRAQKEIYEKNDMIRKLRLDISMAVSEDHCSDRRGTSYDDGLSNSNNNNILPRNGEKPFTGHKGNSLKEIVAATSVASGNLISSTHLRSAWERIQQQRARVWSINKKRQVFLLMILLSLVTIFYFYMYAVVIADHRQGLVQDIHGSSTPKWAKGMLEECYANCTVMVDRRLKRPVTL